MLFHSAFLSFYSHSLSLPHSHALSLCVIIKILNLVFRGWCTIGLLLLIILWYAGCLVHFRVFRNIPNIYSLDSSDIPTPQIVTIKKWPPGITNYPLGAKSSPVKNNWLTIIFICLLMCFLIYLAFVLFHFVLFSERQLSSFPHNAGLWVWCTGENRELALRTSRFGFPYLTQAICLWTTHAPSLFLHYVM